MLAAIIHGRVCSETGCCVHEGDGVRPGPGDRQVRQRAGYRSPGREYRQGPGFDGHAGHGV